MSASTSPFRMILFDLDGTLLKESREISAKNLRTLKALMDRGIKVGLATGRSYRSVQPYVQQLQPNGPLILFNGAKVWCTTRQEFIYENTLSFEQAYIAMKLIREFDEEHAAGGDISDIHVNFYAGNDVLISRKTPRSIESEIKDGVPHTVVGDLAAYLENNPKPPVKIMLIGDPATLNLFKAEYVRRSPEPTSLIHSEWNYLELMQNGINKGQTLKRIEQSYGCDAREIIAFGDNLNDLDLIRFTGLGVAMGNAHDDLKAIAKRTIGHHETDTIHEFLSEVFAL
ncbi:MAG TPA: HAD family hydrolase [Bdellovibrionales bacterium]|nr:HAD family hydrolase [Bdellovibrionales bacterium]